MTCLISALCWVWSAISMALIRSLSLLQKPTNVTVSITRQRSLLFPTTYPVFTGCRAVTECTKKHGKRQPEYCGIHGNDVEECIYSVQALRTTDNVNVTLKGHIQYTKTFNNTVIWYDATPTQKLSVARQLVQLHVHVHKRYHKNCKNNANAAVTKYDRHRNKFIFIEACQNNR